MKQISIGIIGGMGPQASALLHQRLIDAMTKQLGLRECHDFPLITHVSIPAIDFISQPELRHKNRKLMLQAVRTIQLNKPDLVIMACNTAHILINEIPELQQLPLLSLPHAAIKQAASRKIHTVGILASPTTINQGLFQNIAHLHNIDTVILDAVQNSNVETIIRGVIAGNSIVASRKALEAPIKKLLEKGAEAVILGCTELSVARQDNVSKCEIDPLQSVIDEAIIRIRQIQEAHHEPS